MCECLEFDDGSLYLCTPCADEYKILKSKDSQCYRWAKNARAVLEKLEWSGVSSDRFGDLQAVCPCCDGQKGGCGHSDLCELQFLLHRMT